MTKRRVERNLDALSDALLGELTVAERLALTLEMAAEGQETAVTRLIETCPTKSYVCVDMAYQRRVWAAHWWAMEAIYQLETAVLRFQPVLQDWTDQQFDALLTEEDPSAAADEAAEREVAQRFADCVIYYRAYDRFATEVFGVELATWLGLHPNGPALVDYLAEILPLHPAFRARAEAALQAGTTSVAGDPVASLDDAIASVYEDLHTEWTATMAARRVR